MANVPAKILARAKKLRNELHEHDYRYYVLAEPAISDEAYDKLMRELVELEQRYPDLQSTDSPTQRVGGEPTRQFATVAHNPSMLSLANSYSEKEIRDFDTRVRNIVSDGPRYVAELKFDGVAIALKYRGGVLVQVNTPDFGDISDVNANQAQ